MPKQIFRETLLAQRLQLTDVERERLGCVAQSHLLNSELLKAAGCIALYSPTRGEVPTERLFADCQRQGKRVCYPRVSGQRMGFVEVFDLSSLKKGAFGLLEPKAGEVIPVAELDLMVVPGVAFDRGGHRLGYGKGFYDRELHAAGFSGALVGLCYGFQLLEQLPSEQHDVPMDYLLTEQGLFSPLRV